MKTWVIIHSETLCKMNSGIAINRGASRCIDAILNVSLNMKSLYWSNFLREVYDKKYIISIDESGFSNSVKQSYSLFPKGRSSTVIKDVFRGRINFILRVSQEGDYLGLGQIKESHQKNIDYITKILKSLGMNIRKEEEMFKINVISTTRN